jgi:hypothetical protein
VDASFVASTAGSRLNVTAWRRTSGLASNRTPARGCTAMRPPPCLPAFYRSLVVAPRL